MNNRDVILAKTIIDTINEIQDYLEKFECRDYDKFNRLGVLKRATTMCMISISELVDNLSEEFKEENSHINYRRFKTLRNIAAHKYGAVNFEIVWEIITKNLPGYEYEFKKIIQGKE